MESAIEKRLKKAEKSPFDGENVFMHVSAIIPSRTLHNVETQSWPKRNYWGKFSA